MAKAKFTQRLKSLFGGIQQMPQVDPTGSLIFDGQTSFRSFEEKIDQIQANMGWVYLANDTISSTCGAVKFKLLHRKSDGTEEEVFKHPILDLINDPHSAWSSMQFWSLYQQYLNLTGEVYLLRIGKDGKPQTDGKQLPASLLILPSHQCTFQLGKSRWDDSTVLYNGTTYPIASVIRDIVPDPRSPYKGMSVVSKASLSIDTDQKMKLWNNSLFRNGARPNVAVEVPDNLSDTSFKRLQQQFKATYEGADNAFKTIILEGGAKVSPFMMSTQDLDFLASKRFTRDEILSMFKVSPSNVGIVENVNRANAEVQENEFAKRCIVPRMRQLVFVLNKRLIKPAFGDEFELEFENPIIDDRELQLSEASAGVNRWLTIDEVREQYGLEALPDGQGSQLYVPLGQVPMSAVSEPLEEAPTDPEDEPEEKPSKDDEEADENEPAQAPEAPTKAQKKELEKRNIRHELGEQKATSYVKASIGFEKKLMKIARKHFEEQKKQALAWVKNRPKLNLESKAWHKGMVDWEETGQTFELELQALIKEIVATIGTEAYHRLVETGEFDWKNERVLQYIEQSALRASSNIDEETRKQLQATLGEGIRAGEGENQLSARVSQVFGQAGTVRASMIARTESMTAFNSADLFAWEQTGVVSQAEWYMADSEACEFCQALNGTKVKLGTNFFDMGDFATYTDKNGQVHSMALNYRDIDCPPIHPNCRCVLLAVMDDPEGEESWAI